MAALPLPGQGQRPSLDPDEVGYIQPTPVIKEGKRTHDPLACEAEHCSCHLPTVFSPPTLELTGREALVLAWHLFPLNDDSDEELSFETIGKKLGVTETRVRQIYMRAGAKLRGYPRDNYPPRPGSEEYEKRMAAAEKYKADHPEYAQNRALLDAMDQTLTDGADPQ